MQVDQMVTVLNEVYNQYEIFFIWDCNINDIKSSQYYANPGPTTLQALYNQYGTPFALDIFLGNPGTFNGGGWAISTPGDALLVFGVRNGDLLAMTTATIIHEAGHCLGLWHTTNGAEFGSSAPCEHINGDDWINRGDFVLDTPADPFVFDNFSNPNCSFISPQDLCQVCFCLIPGINLCQPPNSCALYDNDNDKLLDTNSPPDEYVFNEEWFTNYMGQGLYDDHCKEHFTPGQINRIYQMIESQSVLQNLTIPAPEIEIEALTASSEFCIGGTSQIEYAVCPPAFHPNPLPVMVTLTPSVEPALLGAFVSFGGDFSDGSETILMDPSCATFFLEVIISPDAPFGTTFQIKMQIEPEQVLCPFYMENGHTVSGTFVSCFNCPCVSGINIGSTGNETFLSENPQIPSVLTGCVAIAGHLIINQSLQFNNAQVTLEPGATIEVQNTLIIRNGSTLQGCEEMWNGIVVKDGGSLIIGEQSSIEDAYSAITAEAGAFIDVQNTIFNRNLNGISSNSEFILQPFAGNTFDCTTPLSPPLSSQYAESGINISNKNLLNIGVQGATPNIFRNLNNGIIATNTTLMVQNTNFEHIKKQSPDDNYLYTGYGILAASKKLSPFMLTQRGNGSAGPVSFVDCTTGIYASGVSVDIAENNMVQVKEGIITEFCHQDIDIFNNSIECINTGIEMSFADLQTNKTIHDNTIDVLGRGAGIFVNEMPLFVDYPATRKIEKNIINLIPGFPTLITTGIHLNSTLRMTVFDNTVNIKAPAIRATGIYVSGNPGGVIDYNHILGNTPSVNVGIRGVSSPSMKWQCNDTEGIGTGFRFDMPCNTTNGFRGNVMKNLQTGLSLSSLTNANGAGGRLGTQTHTANRWVGTFNDNQGATRHEGGIFDIQQSRFFAEQSTSYWPPSIVTPNSSGSWFFPDFPDPNELYLCDLPGFTGEQPIDEADMTIAGNNSTEYGTIRWLSERYLFRKLDENQTLIANTTLESFFNQHKSTSVGRFNTIDNSMSLMLQIGDVTAGQLASNDSLMQQKMNEIRSIEGQLINATGQDSIMLAAERVVLFQDIDSLTIGNAILLDNILAQRSLNAVAVATDLDTISATLIFEQNEKIVNRIFLETIAIGQAGFSSGQIDSLESIASQCPEEGGNAVFKARSILAVINENTLFDDDEFNCIPVEERNRDQARVAESILLEFKLYPNPAKDEIMLEWPSNLAGEGTVVLFDLTGREKFRRALIFDNHKTLLQTNTLPAGIYLCKVIKGNVVIYTEKIILIR